MGTIAPIMGCSDEPETPSTPPVSGHGVIVSVSPINVTLSAGVSLQISASVGNFIHDSNVTWSAYSISENGSKLDSSDGSFSFKGDTATYTAPKTLPSGELSGANTLVVQIRARSNEDTTKTANCTITVNGLQAGPSNITVNPNAVTLQAGQSQQFVAAIAGSSSGGVMWRVLSGPGSISQTGLYTAPSSIIGKSVAATIEAMAKADTAIKFTVPITVIPMPDPGPCFRTVIGAMILSNCSITGCHNPIDTTAGLDFTTYSSIMKTVVAGDTGKSLLWYRINHFASPLTPAQIVQIGQWIVGGAQNTQCQEPIADCDTAGVTYSNFVAPTIKNYCVGCHSGRNVAICDNYDLSTYAGVMKPVIQGELISVITNGTPHMPLDGPQLDSCTVAKLRAWINQGAQNN